MEKSKDKTDHYLIGSDTKLITVLDTTQNVDIGEEPNSKFIDHLPLFKPVIIIHILTIYYKVNKSIGI